MKDVSFRQNHLPLVGPFDAESERGFSSRCSFPGSCHHARRMMVRSMIVRPTRSIRSVQGLRNTSLDDDRSYIDGRVARPPHAKVHDVGDVDALSTSSHRHTCCVCSSMYTELGPTFEIGICLTAVSCWPLTDLTQAMLTRVRSRYWAS